MSTGPGPTRKDDGSHDASVDDIADLLVEDESRPLKVDTPLGAASENPLDKALDKALDDGLDVMLETPGPVLASTFMPPPPSPAGLVGDDSDSGEDAGAATNLAYEDLLAKLVLPAKEPEPEATLPAATPQAPTPLPLPVAFGGPINTPPVSSMMDSIADSPSEPILPSLSSSPTLQAAPPNEERTLVTDNPLVAEEQQAAAREGRSASVPLPSASGSIGSLIPQLAIAGKSKMVYLAFGGLVVFVVGILCGIVVIKATMSKPTPPPAPVAMPEAVPQPAPAPPAQVKPLPPSPAPAPAAAPAAAEPEPEAKPAAAAAEPKEEPAAAEADGEKPQARTHKAHKVAHAATPKPAPAPKAAAAPAPKAAAAPAPKAAAAPAPKAPAPAPAPKPAKPGKKSKTAGYSDPFDN